MRLHNPDTGEEAIQHVDNRGTFYTLQCEDKIFTKENTVTVQVAIAIHLCADL